MAPVINVVLDTVIVLTAIPLVTVMLLKFGALTVLMATVPPKDEVAMMFPVP